MTADPKPKRQWRMTKSGYLTQIQGLEMRVELMAQLNETLRTERFSAEKLTLAWRRLAVTACAAVLMLAGLVWL